MHTLRESSKIMGDPMSTRLAHVIQEIAELLPAQGPISVFVHHNTLHAFEGRTFEEAVITAGQQLGCQPFLSAERYRAELNTGRIADTDIETVLNAELGPTGAAWVVGGVSRFDLRKRIVMQGIPEVRGQALNWLLTETSVLETKGALWNACLKAIQQLDSYPFEQRQILHRHRDLLRETCGIDTDEWVHPVLIRFVSAYLDQGIAHWPMTDRSRGMYQCFLEVYGDSLAGMSGAWARILPVLLQNESKQMTSSLASIENSLCELGVLEEQWHTFLLPTMLALRGWAGMVNQIQRRPDRVPAQAMPATLIDFLAIRLLLERAALSYAAKSLVHFNGPLSELRTHLNETIAPARAPSNVDLTWPLFCIAQLCGLDATFVEQLSRADIHALQHELAIFNSTEQRRILHLAYERHLRAQVYDALVQHSQDKTLATPEFQAVFCIDEREESMRRHLEEVDPAVETLSTVGFFGVAMYYQATTDAHPRPLCPIVIQPEHYVTEIQEDPESEGVRWQRIRRKGTGHVSKALYLASRTLVRGALMTTLLGALYAVPLVLQVLFPWVARRLSRLHLPMDPKDNRTRLVLEQKTITPPIGEFYGFTVQQMATIVRTLLENVGMVDRLSPLVVIVGHGSNSLNNPHESAYDCGACGGGRGGPNARAFAQMANDPRVREQLALEGVSISNSTCFIGAKRNTSDNSVTFFDVDRLPEQFHSLFKRVQASFERARTREAHERCRRFETVPSWFNSRAALMHVEARSADLAQPRPECGHATNAFCVIGRRSRTRNLFLDRRAFLASYDPTHDIDGNILEKQLDAVVPVVAGITLEYYFSYVDPIGYGCGTKLPHNITSLLGVMDGSQSDLRTGLPWQMIEIHEPVRPCFIVECTRDQLLQVVHRNESLRRLVEHRWIFLACLEPTENELYELTLDTFERWNPEGELAVIYGNSVAWYRGKRDHLAFVELKRPVDRSIRAHL